MTASPIRTALLAVSLLAVGASAASAVELQAYDFKDRRTVTMSLLPTSAAPTARLTARIGLKDGQAKIDLGFDSMKPAVLFGGDVTSFVVWAVTPGGHAENLGELVTRKKSDRLSFSTSKKQFALMVTAEPYYLVPKPSELVVFTNGITGEGDGETSAFVYDDFAPAARRGMDTIVHIKWDANVALDLLQARKAFELATDRDAATHAASIYAEAKAALAEADAKAAASPKHRDVFDLGRRAFALANEAINVAAHRAEALELEAWVAEQRAQAEALEQRAAAAEEATRQAQSMAEIAQQEMQRLQTERERMAAETAALADEKRGLETSMGTMRAEQLAMEREVLRIEDEKRTLQSEFERMAEEKAEIERMANRLQQERDEINGRLESALSHVADTTDSARGFVVNLPDILFDVNEASLKPEAQLVLAKLAGILLILPDQQVIVEGHTDSTGSEEYNLTLSEKRAAAVLALLSDQGIDTQRLDSRGFGMARPVADNATPDGRKKNRRVEIVISSGTELAAN